MKVARLNKKIFIMCIAMVHLPFLSEAFWYDEAAVVTNVTNVSISEYFQGLSWLQTIPVGYFLLIKAIMTFESGIFVGRLLSLIFLVVTVIIVDKEYLSKIKNVKLSYLAITILIVNSVSLRYATDVKPYTLELLLSMSLLLASKNNKIGTLVLLSFISPLFSSTAFILGLSSMLVYGFKYREKRYLIPAIIFFLMMYVVSSFIPKNTRQSMINVWFSNSNQNVFQGFKSFVGGIFWLPTAGNGWIPDDLVSNYPLKYELSALLFLLALVVISFQQFHTSEFQVFLTSGCILALLNIFEILPAAGRLIQGFAMLFSILLAITLGQYRESRSKTLILFVVIIISIIGNVKMKALQYSPLVSIENTGINTSIYSSLETAPEIQYLAAKHSLKLNANIMNISDSGKLEGCQGAIIPKGARIYVRKASKSIDFKIHGFTYRPINHQFGYYFATHKVKINQIPNPQKMLECVYMYRNPEKRLANR